MQRTILVADDDIRVVAHIRLALEEQGYGVRTGQSTEEVMSYIKAEAIDLLVLGDTVLGGGWKVLLTWLRWNENASSIPVIMLTSDMEDATAYSAWSQGVDSFQSKRESALPTLTRELSVKINRIFRSLEDDAPV